MKLYFQTYCNRCIFHEHVTNTILDDVVGLFNQGSAWFRQTSAQEEVSQ